MQHLAHSFVACLPSHLDPRSDLIRLSSTVSPPDPDAPSAEPKFSLMHEYSWIIPPSSPSSASALASEGAFEFWGPAASPHRLSIVCAADGSARVRACIRSNPAPSPPAAPVLLHPLRHTLCAASAISLSTTPAARDMLALKDATAAPPPPHAPAALASVNGSHAISREITASEASSVAVVLSEAFSSFCPEVQSVISSLQGMGASDVPRLYVQALSHLPPQRLYGSHNAHFFPRHMQPGMAVAARACSATLQRDKAARALELSCSTTRRLQCAWQASCRASCQTLRAACNTSSCHPFHRQPEPHPDSSLSPSLCIRAAGLRSFEQNREARQQEVEAGGHRVLHPMILFHFAAACSRWRRLALPMSSIMQVCGCYSCCSANAVCRPIPFSIPMLMMRFLSSITPSTYPTPSCASQPKASDLSLTGLRRSSVAYTCSSLKLSPPP